MQILHPFAGSLQQYIPSAWLTRLLPPRALSAVPCQTAPQPHTASIHARSSTLLSMASIAFAAIVPSLPAHRVPAARVRLAYLRSSLTAIAMFLIARLLRGQTIEGAAAARPKSMPTSAASSGFALSCASRSTVCRAGCLDPTRFRARLRPPRPDHARIQRLDRRSPLPVRRRALPPAGLAPRSGSRRPPCRILHRRAPSEPPHTPFAWNRAAFPVS